MTTATTTLGALRPEVKDAWVKALRSGEYEQGIAYLHYQDAGSGTDRYCCLGVLCDLAAAVGVVAITEVQEDEEDHAVTYGYSGAYGATTTTMPPTAVRNWAFAEPPEQTYEWYVEGVEGSDYPVALVGLNDDHGASFAEIADIIETSL